jgi:hypothetical protein
MTTIQSARDLSPRPAAVDHRTAAPPEVATRPTTLRFEHRRHMYFDGKRWLPSVTGICGKVEDKGGLLAGTPTDREVRDRGSRGAVPAAPPGGRRRRVRVAAQGPGPQARQGHGQRVGPARRRRPDAVRGGHPGAHLHPDIRTMAEHVLAFMRDYQVTVRYSEARLAHRSMGYCGTTDQIGIVPQYGDVPLIIDWKTSASMYETPKFSTERTRCSSPSYSRAEVMFWDDKTEADMIEVNQDVGLIVMIRPEGYKVYDYDLVRAWPQFRRAFENYHWWRNTDELAHGPVRPKGMALVTAAEDFAATAAAAESPEELFDAYQRAVAAGAWNDALKETFSRRKVELSGAVA